MGVLQLLKSVGDVPATHGVVPDFTVFTAPMALGVNSSDENPVVHMVGSSSVEDLQGDTMQDSALKDMTTAQQGLAIWLNHDYELPGSLFGGLVGSPEINIRGGVSDLSIAAAVELESENARQVWKYIKSNKARLGCSVGCIVEEWEMAQEPVDDDDWGALFGPVKIQHVRVIEWSVVGIPANQRCWVENAIKGIFSKGLSENKNYSITRLLPKMASLWPRETESLIRGSGIHELEHQLEHIQKSVAYANTGKGLYWEPLTKTFYTYDTTTRKQEYLTENAIPALIEKTKSVKPLVVEGGNAGANPGPGAPGASGPNADGDGDSDMVVDGSGGPANVSPDGTHSVYSGVHTHAHKSYGVKADGDMHSHEHSHQDDNHHDHSHMQSAKDAEPPGNTIDNIIPKDADSPPHGKYKGTHSHAHKTYGSQGSDDGHDHSHSHDDDNNHDHSHGKGVDVGPDGNHDPYTGNHSHKHKAFGKKADGDMHSHDHLHQNDSDHNHPHDNTGDSKTDGANKDFGEALRATMLAHYNSLGESLGFTARDFEGDPVVNGPSVLAILGDEVVKALEAASIAQKAGRRISNESMAHLQIAHDCLKTVTDGAVCGSIPNDGNAQPSPQDTNDGQMQDQSHSARGAQMEEESIKSMGTLVTGMEKLIKTLETLNLKGVHDEVAVMQTEVVRMKGVLGRAEAEAKALNDNMARLKGIKGEGLGNPVSTFINRTVNSDPAAATPAEMGRVTPQTLTEALALTTVMMKDGVRVRHWPEGIGKGVRPELSTSQMSILTIQQMSRYYDGQECDIPMFGDSE